jgi:hypothetical protein
MARHNEIKVATGVQVYFWDPHALAAGLEREHEPPPPTVPPERH